MINREECIQVFCSEYKPRFKKKLQMHVYLYRSYMQCQGVSIVDGFIGDDTQVINVPYDRLKSVTVMRFQNVPCLKIEYYADTLSAKKTLAEIFVLGLDECDDCFRMILKQKELRELYNRQQRALEIEKAEKAKQYEIEAKNFFDECYRFHVKENTPSYTLYSEKNRIVTVYLDDHKGMHFLKIDGYKKSEDIGVIPYDKIHYYEKAGGIHYVAETNGNYSSFGGSLTGATFSKRAALLHGILFGPMGMATAALMSYKPAQQKEAEAHFDIKSETKRIDERNVILNFYSDEKKQYIDIELPQDMYNFLQTYLPQKRYGIVTELEKHEAIKSTEQEKKALEAPARAPELPASKSISLDEFKEKVEKLKLLKEAGLLTDEEFNQMRVELLSSI